MDINIQKVVPSENIMDIKVNSKRLAKDIQKDIRKSHKARNAQVKARKKFSKSLKSSVQRAKAYFDYQKVLRELNKKFRIDALNKLTKRLRELRLGKLINENISESDLVKLERLATLPVKRLRDITSLRNINTNLSKSDLIYALIRSEPVADKEKYFIEGNNEIINKVSEARLLLLKTSSYLPKIKRSKIRKRLYEVENTKKVDRKFKNALLKELNSIISDLKYKAKHMKSDYRDDNYVNIDDIKYILGDIDDYHRPILTSSMFNKGYQKYHIRGDETRSMSVKSYLENIIPFSTMLIDENKGEEQKIEVDIGFNMVHIDDMRRITHFSKSDSTICRPSSDTSKILAGLLSSLYEKYQVDLTTSRTSSSFVFGSVEKCNIRFHKIDLKPGASYIDTPDWIKNKKCAINPKIKNDVYCFMYAITVELDRNEIGKNVERISKKLMQYANKINWHNIDFPASHEDYVFFEQLNSDIALNILMYLLLKEMYVLSIYLKTILQQKIK